MKRLRNKYYQLRHKIHHYLGKDLPNRVLPLKFSIPEISEKVKGSIDDDDRMAHDLEEAQH